MTRIFIAVLCSALVLSSSCYYLGGKRVRGNGNVTTESRSVGAFDEVEVQGAIDVYVRQGEPGPVRVVTDENLQQYIMVESQGNEVQIRFKQGYNIRPSSKVKVYVSSPNFTRLDVSGACNIYGERKLSLNNPLSMQVSGAGDIKMEIDAPKVRAQISGAGSMVMQGQTRDVEIDISGAGKAKCYDLMAENTKVEISGAGSAEVYASVALDAHVSGAGSVKYKGNATKVTQEVSGAGSVKKTD